MVRITESARELTRARLLEAAAEAIAEVGLEAANINAISLSAGCAKGTVYNYFPSKEALFAAVVEEACHRAVADSADPGPQAPLRQRLHALAASDIAWAEQHDPFARVMVREVFSGSPARYGRVVTAAAPFVERVAQVLTEAVAGGEIDPDRPIEELALVFSGLGLLCLAQHWGSSGTWPALADIPDLVVDTFLGGLCPTAEPIRKQTTTPRRR